MAGKYRKKTSAAPRVAVVFAVLAAALAILAAVFGAGQAYHLRLSVDTQNMSRTLEGVLEREDLTGREELDALGMDSDFSLKELAREDGAVGDGIARLRKLNETMSGATSSLFEKDGGEVWRDLRLQSVLDRLPLLGKLLRAFSAAAAALLLAAAGLLLLRKTRASAVFSALAALLIGALPLLVLASMKRLTAGMGGSLAVLERYGIGLELSLSLTRGGQAQVLFAAAALMLCACSWMTVLYAAGRKKR